MESHHEIVDNISKSIRKNRTISKESSILGPLFNCQSEQLIDPALRCLPDIAFTSFDGLIRDYDCEKCPRPNLITSLRHSKKHNNSKVLLCHDYRYNYLERTLIENGHPISDHLQFYTFLHWSMIDYFAYFTHKLITVPPCEWISASHQNGVKCLGTLIIEEWSSYILDSKILKGDLMLESMLSDENLLKKIVHCMHSIQNEYQFDGWLLNIETNLNPKYLGKLYQFISMIKEPSKILIESPIVIWYDSLNSNGELKHQNEFNGNNEIFFEKCDAIFLNYCWTEENLQKSLANVTKLEKEKSRIFVGIDCYGRGCYGGGGLNTFEAVQKILQYKLSIAIFAPGWTHESKLDNDNLRVRKNKSSRHSSDKYYSKDYEKYCFDDEFNFWSKIACEGGLQNCEKSIAQLPLYTNFNIGCGFRYNLFGKQLPYINQIDFRWFNLNHSQLQPSFFNSNLGPKISFEHSFNGGTSLYAEIFDLDQLKSVVVFKTDISFSKIHRFYCQVISKVVHKDDQIEKWIRKNLRLKIIADFEVFSHSNNIISGHKNQNIELSMNESDWTVIGCEESKGSNPHRYTSHSYIKHQTYEINGWMAQMIILDLKHSKRFTELNNKLVKLIGLQIKPYLSVENKSSKSRSFSKNNPLKIFIGEFYFNNY
ncbi:Cytosolic endo-beta-N-acetylglucosaminidase [Sarcoptes scabiei]|uniref:Cytosolic endo-beta-N-acetylglucosaminidase n=1 Tax=Sarcoptes scabiei TaxID=52283 RepID=A0A834R5Z7_SARSC|nr:Cytosolic endo-beta-N-acetylglucosaminidase [Sarcoptes scabiei]